MVRNIIVKVPDTIIGVGAISNLGDIARSFNPKKILVITDAVLTKVGIVDAIKKPLEAASLRFEIFDGCKPEPPIPLLSELTKKIKEGGYDLLIGVGGGSNMDTTKIVSITAGTGMAMQDYISTGSHQKIEGNIIPKILIPTTAGTGAEWSIAITAYQGQDKYIVHAWDNLANKVIIDPELTVTMPQRVTADTGIDALTHAIEAYTSPTANVYSDMLAGTAVKMISGNLRQAYAKGQQNIEARYNMSIAAAFSMNAANSSSIGLSHLMGEILGSRAHISHGTTVGLTLPCVMEYNLVSNPAKFAKVAELMGEYIRGLSVYDAAAKSVDAVKRLIKDVDLPLNLKEVGITEADIPEMARKCYGMYAPVIPLLNPRDAAEKDIAQIFLAAL
jgi:alcohol dehydrogenase class IV